MNMIDLALRNADMAAIGQIASDLEHLSPIKSLDLLGGGWDVGID